MQPGEDDPYAPYKHQFTAPESELESSQFGDSNLSAKQTGMLARLKESNMKLSVQQDKADEEIERCHDQIAR